MYSPKITALLCLILGMIFSNSTFSQTGNSTPFSFTLKSNARTSAGVYKTDSTLVRTLWANKTYAAGQYVEYWDGKDDYGNIISSPDATYDIKVLSSNVNYSWDGIIGNTSKFDTGYGVHRNVYTSMTGMAITGTTAYFCQGYSELNASIAKFNTNSPQIRIDLKGFAGRLSTLNTDFVATDGTNVYWAGYDAYATINAMVYATAVSNDTQVNFGTNGASYSTAHVNLVTSAIDKLNISNAKCTGLAVQQSGNYLFVAHGGLNELHVLNKTTGALVQKLSFTNPRYLSCEGNSLWMVTGTNTIARYTVNNNGTLTSAILALSGIIFPGAMQANAGGTLAVIDQSKQVVRFFNTTSGVEGIQLGTSGGYATSPDVTNTKYFFNDYRGNTFSFLAYAPDGSFWMGDPGNYRELHFTAGKNYIETIMSMGASYSSCADPNNITRVFGNYLEFAINYSQPLTGSTGWRLVKNWGYYETTNTTNKKLLNVTTLSNGRTYGVNGDALNARILVELTSTGLRNTGVLIGNGVINTDGSLTNFAGAYDTGKNVVYSKYLLTGFNTSNDPIWSITGTTLATTPKNTLLHPDNFPGNVTPTSYNFVTTSGKVIFYNPSKYYKGLTTIPYNGYHLGAIKTGYNTWLWETQKSNHTNYAGAFPGPDYFEMGNIGNQYAGSNLNVVGNNIITGYHGEFWKNGQTNYYNHYWEDGLPVGQFGTDMYVNILNTNGYNTATPALAGNALNPTAVKDTSTGNIYLFHGDESNHGGIHRWSITNLNSILEQTINIPFPSTSNRVAIGYLDLHSGLPFNATLPNSAGWSTTGAITSNTSLKKYINDGSPDVFSMSGIASGTAAVNRDLGVNNVTSNWKISGQLTFEKSDFVVGSATKQYVDVLDAAGKIIARFNYVGNSSTKVITIYSNSAIVDSSTGLDLVLGMFQPFEVNAINGSITFIYANYPPVTTTIFDATANWRQPKTLRQYWTCKSTPARNMYIGFMDMKFYKDYSQAINIPPIANAGSDQSITLPSNSVTLTGTGTDADGTITNYLWTKISGPSSSTISNSNNATTNVTGLAQGIYAFELKVTDNVGATGVDTVQIIVNTAANIPPVANAGLDQTITLPSNNVTLTGTGTDADGTITNYLWRKISGPSSSTISNSNNATTNVTGLAQGTYAFELKVTDNGGASSVDTVQITVNTAANIPPVADAGSDQSITLPANSVTLAGTGTDADGNVTNYLWRKVSGPLSGTITNVNNAATTVTGMAQGIYSFELKVTDNGGATGVDTVQVIIIAATNIPPVADAGLDQSITLPLNSGTLSGTGTDADGNITSYLWTKISGPAPGTITNANKATTNITSLVQGTYSFELKVTDNGGASDVDTVQILVNPPANIPPVSNAGPDQAITLPVNIVSLAGSGGDADGSIVAYAWRKISGPSSYNIVNASSPVTDISGLINGVYAFELKVIDNSGAIASDTMEVTVNVPGNIPPTADAGSDQMLILPKNKVVLNGTGNDPDGTVTSYLWTEIAGPQSAFISKPNIANTVVNNLVQGDYLFELKVTDNMGTVGKDTMQITVVASSLPLKLLSFTGKIQNELINLYWETTNEKNVLGFEIERKNATTWNKIGFVPANNAGLVSNLYTFTDSLPSIGSNYYRLKIVDIDGKFVYSDIISFEMNPGKNLIYQNFPNPFSKFTTIKFGIVQKSSVKIIVYNSIGIQVAVLLNEIRLPGVYQIQWDAENVAQGDYFYKVIVGDNITTNKMLKQH
ncbi:MAG: hypothetical protein M3015_14180 [Bacteroidota bacterium]|nr:hypothetical protein [Bacteroidota bacterium]